MAKLLSSDFTAVMKNGRPFDRATFIERVAAMPDTNTWQLRDGTNIHFYGTTALVTYALADSNPEPHEDQYTHVFVNADGQGWRMARLHISHPFLSPQGKK